MRLTAAERTFHRKAMARCFNTAWTYLLKPRRSKEDDRTLLLMAHSARYHAGVVGTARNWAIGDWQVSRAYAALGQGPLALEFAQASLSTIDRANLDDLRSTALEATARAYAVNGEFRRADKFVERAKTELDRAEMDDEGRDVFRDQIRDTERLLRRLRAKRSRR